MRVACQLAPASSLYPEHATVPPRRDLSAPHKHHQRQLPVVRGARPQGCKGYGRMAAVWLQGIRLCGLQAGTLLLAGQRRRRHVCRMQTTLLVKLARQRCTTRAAPESTHVSAAARGGARARLEVYCRHVLARCTRTASRVQASRCWLQLLVPYVCSRSALHARARARALPLSRALSLSFACSLAPSLCLRLFLFPTLSHTLSRIPLCACRRRRRAAAWRDRALKKRTKSCVHLACVSVRRATDISSLQQYRQDVSCL